MNYIRKSAEESRRHRLALLVQYDGSGFNGWQVQNSGRTVQAEMERGLGVLFRESIKTVAAGRTDAGVHAFGQVIHFDISSRISLQKLCISLNGILAKDVKVKNAYAVPPEFHARFGAVKREYVYIIYNHPLMSPFISNRATWVSAKLDIEKLRELALCFVGEMDFASFCKKTSANENTVRRIDEFEISSHKEFIFLRITGTAFLHNMIRIMVGTMLETIKSGADAAALKAVIDERTREAGGATAPACGLYLNRIFYNPDLDEMESAW